VIELEFASGGRMRIIGAVGAYEGAGEEQAAAMIPVPDWRESLAGERSYRHA
jgi:hypothetical protein